MNLFCLLTAQKDKTGQLILRGRSISSAFFLAFPKPGAGPSPDGHSVHRFRADETKGAWRPSVRPTALQNVYVVVYNVTLLTAVVDTV